MLNSFNQVTVTVNAGDVNEVEEIQVCFKFGDETIIKVAEEIEADGTSTTYDVDFDNSKNYTVLPQSEILRLYDNVPRLAVGRTFFVTRISSVSTSLGVIPSWNIIIPYFPKGRPP